MAIEEKRLILKYADQPGYTNDIDCYIQHGGYEDLKKAFKMKPEDICQEVLDSGVRGRGGAGRARRRRGAAGRAVERPRAAGLGAGHGSAAG